MSEKLFKWYGSALENITVALGTLLMTIHVEYYPIILATVIAEVLRFRLTSLKSYRVMGGTTTRIQILLSQACVERRRRTGCLSYAQFIRTASTAGSETSILPKTATAVSSLASPLLNELKNSKR